MSALEHHIRSLPAADRQDRTQVISHELRTPLAIIQGYARMIGEESEGNLGHLTEPLLEAVDRLGRVVQALVDFEDQSTSEVPTPSVDASGSRIPLDHLANRIVQRVMTRHQNCQIDMVMDLEEGTAVPTSAADPMSRALEAVLDNAVRFTREGRVTIRSRMEADTLHLTVLDEGPGFPEGSISLTSAFQQGSQGMARRHGGLGLGLHMTKKALTSLNGTLHLKSRTDRSGARVTLRIPLTPAHTTLRAVPKPTVHRRAA